MIGSEENSLKKKRLDQFERFGVCAGCKNSNLYVNDVYLCEICTDRHRQLIEFVFQDIAGRGFHYDYEAMYSEEPTETPLAEDC